MTVAGLVNALKIVGKKIKDVRIVMNGAGASNISIARLILYAGADPKKMVMIDSKGALHPGRDDLKTGWPQKWHYATTTNAAGIKGGCDEALKGADVLISLSKSGPGVIQKEWISAMGKDSVVFCCANPVPEIWPWEAKEAGARIVATGRSDFPNQVNNSLGFPGIFRGTLDVMAKTITDEMCIEASYELARCAEDKGMNEDYLIPTMDEWEVYPREAVAVGQMAIKQGVARIKMSPEEAYKIAERVIKRAREQYFALWERGVIAAPPDAPKE